MSKIIKKSKQNDEFPSGNVRKVKDFLPPPHMLKHPKKNDQVILNLDKELVIFYKKESKKLSLSLEEIISEVLRNYALKFKS